MKKALAESVRADILALLREALANAGEDVDVEASNKLNFPTVKDGEEGWVVVTVSVPSDVDYDGYVNREVYAEKVKANAEKKAKAEAEKARKKAEAEAKKAAKASKA